MSKLLVDVRLSKRLTQAFFYISPFDDHDTGVTSLRLDSCERYEGSTPYQTSTALARVKMNQPRNFARDSMRMMRFKITQLINTEVV
jgi:hypothetical protein